MKKNWFRQLKDNKGTVTVKVEEVLKPIFAKGLLSQREMQIVFAIIADSWRWQNRQYTQKPVTLKNLSQDTRIEYTRTTRIWKSLVRRNVIKLDENKRASFNEHWEEWEVAETATSRKVARSATHLAETARSIAKSATQARSNRKIDNKIQDPKITYKNNVKNKKRGAQKKRALAHPHFQEFIGWWKQTWSENNNGELYVWSGIDGKHLRRLLANLGFDKLKARAEYAFANAGQPGPLSWFKPPFTFPQFAGAEVINKCSGLAGGSAGYVDVNTLIEQEQASEAASSC